MKGKEFTKKTRSAETTKMKGLGASKGKIETPYTNDK